MTDLETDTSTPLILVADDDPAILAATSRVCTRAGYRVVEAGSGLEAVNRARETTPDLALIDVELGDMDGRDICRTLRAEAQFATTFFVLISGSATSTDDRAYGLTQGGDGYLTRPIGNDELRAWLRAYLRLREAEQARRTAEQHAERTSRLTALGTLAGGASHEIANPLTGILNYAELIRARVADDEKLSQYAEGIIEEGLRIDGTIRMMRQLGQVGLLEVPQAIDVDVLLNRARKLVSTQYREQNGIDVEEGIVEALTVSAPNAETIYVLTMLMNACRVSLARRQHKAAPPGRIQLSAMTAPNGTHARITVADNSDGMPEDVCSHLFEPFQVQSKRAHEQGLDLAVAYRLTEHMNGMLSVESELGNGTHYSLDLPLATNRTS